MKEYIFDFLFSLINMEISIPGFVIDNNNSRIIIKIDSEYNVVYYPSEPNKLYIDKPRTPDMLIVTYYDDKVNVKHSFQCQKKYSAEFAIEVLEKYMVLSEEQIFVV